MRLVKVISGGQTGSDRGALAAAQAAGVPIGGWVPRGRSAEDGRIADEFIGLVETASSDPRERTVRNVLDSDGTLIVSHGMLQGGSALTRSAAAQHDKPCLWLDLAALSLEEAAARALAWLEEHQIRVLNVAGPRASQDARSEGATFALVRALLAKAS